MVTQDEIFAQYEGDNWYRRNIGNLTPKDDLIISILEQYNTLNENSKVLEIGCANGYRLAKIYEKYKADVYGIEPSAAALADGQKKWPFIKFFRSTIKDFDVFNAGFEEYFNLIIVNSVLHWIDRKYLLISIAQIDRMLKDGGYLIIGDFQTPFGIKNKYKHIEQHELFTYKIAYKEIFKSTWYYMEIINIALNHDKKNFNDIQLENYFSITLLRKTDLFINPK